MKSRFPDALALLTGCILLGAALTYVLPAGRYDRRDDAATGRAVVVAGTYKEVPSRPVNLFQALVAVPRGIVAAGSVIALVFLVGGAFTVVDETGALRQGVGWLVHRLHGRTALVIPVVSLAFATAGALENMQEEIIALVPVLLLLTRRLGFPAVTAAAISLGAAGVGAAFSPINPFQVGIAQKLAGLPLLSGSGARLVFLAVALGLWIWWTMRYTARHRREPEAGRPDEQREFHARTLAVLALVLATFGVFIYGVMRLGWDFNQMSGLFFAMGVVVGLVGGLGVGGTAEAFARGFGAMAYAAVLIGFARAVFVVLDQGLIIDTVVHGLVLPLRHLPIGLSALGMMVVHTLLHVPVPSVSGQAVLTMPVLVPMSDLLGLSRQVTVLAYQFGAGLCDLVTPTNGALMAIIAAFGIRYEDWLEFFTPIYVLLLAFGALAIVGSIATGLA